MHAAEAEPITSAGDVQSWPSVPIPTTGLVELVGLAPSHLCLAARCGQAATYHSRTYAYVGFHKDYTKPNDPRDRDR